MGNVKGCGNETCVAYEKKITYKETETFCSKCGSPLVYVCKDCYTLLPDDSEKYCVRCLAKRSDRRDKAIKVVGSVGGGIAGIGITILAGSKKTLDIVKNIKG